MAVTPPPDLLDVPGYRIIRTAAITPNSAMYEAEREHNGERVALKVFTQTQIDEKRRERFFLEANILLRLQHAGVAKLHQTGMCRDGDDNRYYHVMEWVDGLPLLKYADERKLDLAGRIALLLRVCDVVTYIHKKKVLHRNLEPQNILVDQSGQPKLVDFGMARLSKGMPRLTAPGQIVGSFPYLSPEQARGNPDELDERLDVYALGGIGYTLLAGRPPLDVQSKNIGEALMMILETAPPRLGEVNPACAGPLEDVFARALAKERDARPASAEEFAAQVVEAMKTMGI